MVVGWQVDQISLDASYRKLQQEFHPDRYASKGAVEKRLAVQTASLINQAYDTLKSPLKRAQYLLELKQIDASQDSHITSDGAFLMQQIELREALSEALMPRTPLLRWIVCAAELNPPIASSRWIFRQSIRATTMKTPLTASLKCNFQPNCSTR